jgi:hypothetical protein
MKAWLILSILILVANSGLVNYGNYDSTIPSYTYAYSLNAGDTIVATLSWPDTSADLDIYIYRQGSDLLSRTSGVWLAR